jgi:hypothetical protein
MEYLHCVAVKKPIGLGVARMYAQQWIPKRRRFYREVGDWYMFRCMPSKWLCNLRRIDVSERLYLVIGDLVECDATSVENEKPTSISES